MEQLLKEGARFMALGVETSAAAIIAFGAIEPMYGAFGQDL